MAIVRTRRHWAALIGTIAFLLLIPLIVSNYYVNFLSNIFITVIAALGLQIVTGYCGQISLGQPAFIAVGAFTSAILTAHFHLSFWLALPLSGVAAGLVGLIGGAPSLRIKGFYLAMATVAIFYLIVWLITHLKITGGTGGLTVPPPQIGNMVFDTDKRMYYIVMIVTLIMTFYARNLVRTRVGRAFIAIRDNDIAAEVMGINLYYYKLLAFFISCFYAGVAGSLMAHWYLMVHSDQYTIVQAVFYIGMIIIGGMGSIPGTYFGVILVRLIDEVVLFCCPLLSSTFPWVGRAPAASLGVSAFGLVLILFILYEPNGLAYRWEVIKASYRIYPFKN
ncbi:MAG: branched-chain amino acid ABC transporter permease [Proteobacteria bacterium]|nr:branched-chain amino acid ABC transporter permease [Pseudomonadota bacterium]